MGLVPRYNQWVYHVLGPTTIHFQHELSLLITLIILTAASLVSLYRTSFGIPGDYRYLFLTTLCLSRHLIHRIICTTDVGTSIRNRFSPARIWIWLFSAGHYFDSIDFHGLSSSPSALLLTQRGGAANTLSSGVRVVGERDDLTQFYMSKGSGLGFMGVVGGNITGVPFHRLWIFSKFVIRPVVYLGASGKYVLMKLSSRRRVARGIGDSADRESFDDNHFCGDGDSSIPHDERFSQIIAQLHRDLNWKLDVVWEYLPQVQLIVATFSFLACLWFLKYASTMFVTFRGGNGRSSVWTLPRGWTTALTDNRQRMHPLAYKHSREQLGLNNDLMAQRFQATRHSYSNMPYEKEFFYRTYGILCMLGIVGSFTTLLVYGRLLLPLLDLVSNTGVLGLGKVGGKLLKSRRVEKPWAESYKSIESEDRFYLYGKVALLRILENLFLCGILPQMEYVCKATGHCETDTMIFELNGIPSVTGLNGRSMFDNIIQDRLSAFIIIVTIVLVTVLILISQAATLDRTFLSRKGYIDSFASNDIGSFDGKRSNAYDGLGGSAGGRRSGKKSNGSMNDTTAQNPFLHQSQDNIAHHKGSFNKWTLRRFNFSASGRNLRHRVNQVFSNEIGALATSRVLAVCSHLHLLHCLFIILFLSIYVALEKNLYALALTFAAVVNSSGAMDIGLLEYDELEIIADEVSVCETLEIHSKTIAIC